MYTCVYMYTCIYMYYIYTHTHPLFTKLVEEIEIKAEHETTVPQNGAASAVLHSAAV